MDRPRQGSVRAVTIDHERLAAAIERERDLAGRGVKRGRETPAKTPVTRPKLLPVDWRLLERLAGYGPHGIWPAVPELAAKLRTSDRTVQRSLGRLEAASRVERVATFERPDDPEWQRRGRRTSHRNRQTTNSYRVTGPGDTTIGRISDNAAAQTPVTRPESDESRVTPRTTVSSSSGECRDQGPGRSAILTALEQAFGPVRVLAEWPNDQLPPRSVRRWRTREEVGRARRRARAPPPGDP